MDQFRFVLVNLDFEKFSQRVLAALVQEFLSPVLVELGKHMVTHTASTGVLWWSKKSHTARIDWSCWKIFIDCANMCSGQRCAVFLIQCESGSSDLIWHLVRNPAFAAKTNKVDCTLTSCSRAGDDFWLVCEMRSSEPSRHSWMSARGVKDVCKAVGALRSSALIRRWAKSKNTCCWRTTRHAWELIREAETFWADRGSKTIVQVIEHYRASHNNLEACDRSWSGEKISTRRASRTGPALKNWPTSTVLENLASWEAFTTSSCLVQVVLTPVVSLTQEARGHTRIPDLVREWGL